MGRCAMINLNNYDRMFLLLFFYMNIFVYSNKSIAKVFQIRMEIVSSDIRCAISIRGTRSSTTNEMIRDYCTKYGKINYFHCAFNPQGIMCGYNVVFHDEQAVNRFMDTRPHQIDGQSGRSIENVRNERSI